MASHAHEEGDHGVAATPAAEIGGRSKLIAARLRAGGVDPALAVGGLPLRNLVAVPGEGIGSSSKEFFTV